MRILITADLHYRPALRERYLAFSREVEALQPDCFIIAGDVGHPLRLFQRGLQLFRNLACPRLLITGNHDVYRGEYSSRALWEQWLPQIAQQEDFVWPEQQTFRLGNMGICGTMGWYDYSSGAPELSYTPGDYRAMKRLVNHDADYIDWPWSDQAMARYLYKGFAAGLARLARDPAVQQILVVTHMPIFACTIPRRPESDFWSLLSAYLGNFTLGELVLEQPKVTHVVSGHLHRAGFWQLPGSHGPIDCHVLGSMPGAPTLVTLDFADSSLAPGRLVEPQSTQRAQR